jgi:hypothetical protein
MTSHSECRIYNHSPKAEMTMTDAEAEVQKILLRQALIGAAEWIRANRSKLQHVALAGIVLSGNFTDPKGTGAAIGARLLRRLEAEIKTELEKGPGKGALRGLRVLTGEIRRLGAQVAEHLVMEASDAQ